MTPARWLFLPFVVTALYYLLARAEATRWLWSRYPESWNPLVLCPACSGAWLGAVVALAVGQWWLAVVFIVLAVLFALPVGVFGPVLVYGVSMSITTVAALWHDAVRQRDVATVVIPDALLATALAMVTTPILFGAMKWGLAMAAVEAEAEATETETETLPALDGRPWIGRGWCVRCNMRVMSGWAVCSACGSPTPDEQARWEAASPEPPRTSP